MNHELGQVQNTSPYLHVAMTSWLWAAN